MVDLLQICITVRCEPYLINTHRSEDRKCFFNLHCTAQWTNYSSVIESRNLLLYTKIVTLWSERENQQDATVRCLLWTFSQHVSGIIMPIFRRPWRVLLHVVCCAGSAGCGAHTLQHSAPQLLPPHPAVPAQHTTCSNTRLGLLKMCIMMPETCWESVDNKHLTVASCWFSLSLHNLLTMHGHRNLKLVILFRAFYKSQKHNLRVKEELCNVIPTST